MHEVTEQAPVSKTASYAIALRWILSHIILLSPGFVMFIWMFTVAPNSPSACLALPLIIIAAFAARAIGIVKVFEGPAQYLRWIVAFGAGFGFMFFTLFLNGMLGGSRSMQAPWGIALIGGITGLIEAFVLLTSYKRAWWWVPANAAGLMLGTLATTQLSAPIRDLCRGASTTGSQCGYPAFILPVVTGVTLYSIITGATLAWIARHQATVHAQQAHFSRSDLREAAGAGGAFVFVLLGSVVLTQFSFIPQQAAEQAINHKANTHLADIDMVSPQEGWAVGGDGSGLPVMYQFTGGNWTEVDLPNASSASTLDSVSMTSADEGWAVGAESTFLHYSNGTWTRALPPAAMSSGAIINSVEMLTPSDGWAIVLDQQPGQPNPNLWNSLLHYNGEKWDYVQTNTTDNQLTLTQLSFSTPNNGWAIGFWNSYPNLAAATLHYTGGEWRNVDNQITADLNYVQALSPDDAWFAASDHTVGTTIFHYVDGKWSTSESSLNQYLTTLHMISPNEGWAIGRVDIYVNNVVQTKAAMARYDGTRWVRTPQGTPLPYISQASMISPTEGWAVGGSTFYHYQNSVWTAYTQP